MQCMCSDEPEKMNEDKAGKKIWRQVFVKHFLNMSKCWALFASEEVKEEKIMFLIKCKFPWGPLPKSLCQPMDTGTNWVSASVWRLDMAYKDGCRDMYQPRQLKISTKVPYGTFVTVLARCKRLSLAQHNPRIVLFVLFIEFPTLTCPMSSVPWSSTALFTFNLLAWFLEAPVSDCALCTILPWYIILNWPPLAGTWFLEGMFAFI